MTTTYPSTRRWFKKAEFRNTAPDVASLVREMMRWQNTTYARDLLVTPGDGSNWNGLEWTAGQGGIVFTPVSLINVAVGEFWLGDAYCLDPKTTSDTVAVRLYVDLLNSSATGRIRVRNMTTGADVDVTVSYAALGSSLSGWLNVDVPASADDTLRVVAKTDSATDYFWARGVSMWWKPKADSTLVGIGDSFVPRKRAEMAGVNGPHSIFALHYLAGAMNRLVESRPNQIAARWNGNIGYGSGNGWSGFPRKVGAYKVVIGERVSEITVTLKTKMPVGETTSVLVTVGSLGTISITHAAGLAYRTTSGTLAITGGLSAPTEVEITLEVQGSPTYCEVAEVAVYETNAAVNASGDTVPTDFVPHASEVWSGSPIRDDAMATLLANTAWLWRYRRLRHLVLDSRWAHSSFPSPYVGVDGSDDLKAHKVIRPSRFSPYVSAGLGVPVRAIGQAHVGGSVATTQSSGFYVEMAAQANPSAYQFIGPPSDVPGVAEDLAYGYPVLNARFQIPQSSFPTGSTVSLRARHAGTSDDWYSQKGYLLFEELPLGTPVIPI